MAPRGSIVAAWIVVALLAFAGAVEAKGGKPEAPQGPPEHAKAKGHAKQAEPPPFVDAHPAAPKPEPEPAPEPEPDPAPEPAPPEDTDAPPVSSAPPPPRAAEEAPPPASDIVHPPHEEHADPAVLDQTDAAEAPAPMPTPAPQPAAPAGASPARDAAAQDPPAPDASPPPAPEPAAPTPVPAAPEPRADADGIDVDIAAGGARVPSWSGPSVPPRDDASDEARGWLSHLAWALPIVGAGGVAAVLLTRQKRRNLATTPPLRQGRMVPVSPDDLRGILHNGQQAAARGAYADAVAWFDRALRLSPKLAVAHFCKGVCLAANGRAAEAYGALRAACAAEPADASYRVHFARVALALGKHKEAMDALELVARAMPELGQAMLEDPQLAALRDHPRFLMICGAL